MNAQLQEYLKIERSLREGLGRQEFFLVFQPRLELRTLRIAGAEALVRWRHPEWGILPPGRFIPVAEQSGLILPLGEQVLRLALQQLRDWLDAGIHLSLSVNISPRQFARPEFPRFLRGILQEYRIEPGLLRLELTESSLMADLSYSQRVLEELQALGVEVEINDFGTGYSSLNYLRQLAVRALKVDRTFLLDVQQGPEQSPKSASVVRAILALGQSLGLEVIAEGIETLAQKEFLIREGCAWGQGYLLCPPVSAQELLHRFGL